MKRTLTTKEDVTFFVDEFYKKVREHKILGPVFSDQIGHLWFLHLDTLSRFWETLLLGNRTYFGDPFPNHLKLPIKDEYFDMWIVLLIDTIDEFFEGEKAEEAKLKGQNLAKSFRKRLDKAGTLL